MKKSNKTIGKIKLPRKRKKAYIKKFSDLGYISMQIANEVVGKNNFPETKLINGKVIHIKNW